MADPSHDPTGGDDGGGGDDDGGADFGADELVMLRQFFRDEAHEALETVTARALAAADGVLAPDAVTEMMRVTHTLKGSAGTVGLRSVVDLAHRFESALSGLRAGQISWTPAVADLVVEIADGVRSHVDATDAHAAAAIAEKVRRLCGLLAEAPGPGAPQFADGELDRTTEMPLRRPRIGTDSGVVQAVADEAHRTSTTMRVPVPAAGDGSAAHDARSVLRVDAERVDDLMAAAGELLFDRTRIERRVQQLRTLARDLGRTRQTLRDDVTRLRGADSPEARGALELRLGAVEAGLAEQATQLAQATAALLDDTEALRRTIASLQKGLTRVRMQTARALFTNLARSLRAVARTAGARVELRTAGDDTEFDKAVAEQVTDPLVQILRNAVVHGIEPPEERARRGKSPVGTVSLAARQEGNLVVIEVSDDGRGIDTGKLRQRFVDAGQWTASKARLASDADVLAALFDAGVSSRDEADELSGRGIGLDLVRETIARLGGEITVTSLAGRGTTFMLRLPVSTAVSHAMLFKVGGQVYAIPNVHVERTVAVEGDATSLPLDGPDGEPVPLVALPQVLATPAAPPAAAEKRTALVLGYAGKVLAVTVDKVIGPREIVVRPLGALLSPLPLFAGATVSASGKVQLILDVAHLARLAHPGAGDDGAMIASMEPRQLAGRVLVVDDSRAIREALTTMLAREGWIVDVADDGSRAWQMAQQLRYDLLVTDLEMPRMTGFELIERVRGDDGLAATPVIVITSRTSPENRRRARELGVRSMVAKPVTRRKLLEALPPDRA
ncbi:MAG: response regulator [Kofleriaceae bacterium]|nr:response regulator [Kofleriaceae bacterium]